MSKQIPTSGGSPFRDNTRRRDERKLDHWCNQIHITNENGRIARKRKKYIHNTERANYRELIISVAKHLERDRSAA